MTRPDVLARRDARLHRCGGCGGWCYGAQPCGTCADALDNPDAEQEPPDDSPWWTSVPLEVAA